MIPERFDPGSSWVIPGGRQEPACWPITALLRRHAVHLTELPGVEHVAVWEEPLFGVSCVGASIVVCWAKAWKGGRAAVNHAAIAADVTRRFPDWVYMEGFLTTYYPHQQQIAFVKDRWGRPYPSQEG